MSLTSREIEDYAEYLIESHAQNIEFMTVFDMYDEWDQEASEEISSEDAKKVMDAIGRARVSVRFS